MKPQTLTAAFALSIGSLHAQIEVISNPEVLIGLNSLSNAGPKFLEIWRSEYADTIRVLNLDLSTYRSLVMPPLPPDWHMRDLSYVTEDLFDTDPNTIEFVYRVEADSGPGQKLRVAREDGTILLEVYGVVINEWSGDGYGKHTMMGTSTGTYWTVAYLGELGDSLEARVFHLPGKLPCDPCSAIAMGGTGGNGSLNATGAQAFPNPSTAETTIRYALPDGARGALVLSTVSGAVVARFAIAGSGNKVITTSELASGTYLYHVETDHERISAKRLVVVK